MISRWTFDRRPGRPFRGLLIASAVVSPACGGAGSDPLPDDLIDRETFVVTYVELRAAALDTEDFVIPDSARERVLSEQGVEGADLLQFAEVHGRDVEFMREVWNEVERLLDERTVEEAGR